jgi:hypothetical protein
MTLHKWQDFDEEITIHSQSFPSIMSDSVEICQREHCDVARAMMIVYGFQYINGRKLVCYELSKRALMDDEKDFYYL